jgi:PAS domain S-box-containing protein
VLANVNEGILVADALQPDCPIEYVNAGFTRMTGYTEAELLGRNCRLIQGSNTDPDATRRLGLAIKEQRPATVELLNYRKDGSTFWNLTSITPLRNAQGQVVKYVGVQHDLTDAKLREKEMVAAQRLKAVGEMTGGIAHDFNNLLTAISGAAELLAQRLAGDPESAPLVEAIRGAAQRGAGQWLSAPHSPAPVPGRQNQTARAGLAQAC